MNISYDKALMDTLMNNIYDKQLMNITYEHIIR